MDGWVRYVKVAAASNTGDCSLWVVWEGSGFSPYVLVSIMIPGL
jgi:hypothetical protein